MTIPLIKVKNIATIIEWHKSFYLRFLTRLSFCGRSKKSMRKLILASVSLDDRP